jgi:hypothetical protein
VLITTDGNNYECVVDVANMYLVWPSRECRLRNRRKLIKNLSNFRNQVPKKVEKLGRFGAKITAEN